MEYLSLNEYARQRFGCKLYKLSLDGGFTCPNRDGTKGTGGCIFCTGSSEFAEGEAGNITEQIENAKKRVESKNKNGKYIAYFSSFTNTYSDTERLRKLFYGAVNNEDILVLDIATRPDCLGEDVLDLLGEINEIKPVWVELGLQTASDKTAEMINRCYRTEEYVEAAAKLHERGIDVITHIIFGLPGETDEMMLDTVRLAVKCKTDGIKIHNLFVSENTELAEMYRRGEIRCLEEDEYIDLLKRAISLIPKNVVVHRLTGDGDKRTLIAPMWTANKKRVLNDISKAFSKE